MKKHLIATKSIAALTIVSLFVSGSQTALAASRAPKVSDELFDYRRLDEKFMAPDEDYIWNPAESSFLSTDEKYNITITADMLDVSPGTIVHQGYLGDCEGSPYDYYISVPKIKQDGKTTNALKDYGVFEIFSYYQVEGAEESWRGYAELYLFNKDMLKKHPITVNTWSTIAGPNAYAGFSMLFNCYSSCDYDTSTDAVNKEPYNADYCSAYYGKTSWFSEESKAVFTKTSLDMPESELKSLIKRAEDCNILSRETIEEQFTEEDGTMSLNMERLFNPITGPLGDKFTYKNGYNGYHFITPTTQPGIVIAVRKNEIYIGMSARPFWEDAKPDVERDKIFVGKYYEDTSKNPEYVLIDSPQFDNPTKNTIDELLRLLLDSGIYWPGVDAHDYDLY